MVGVLFAALFATAHCDFSKMETWIALDEVSQLRSMAERCDLTSDSRSLSGQTLLMTATDYNSVQSMKWLIESGASVNSVDSKRLSALHLARTTEAARLLLEASAEVGRVDAYGRTPFQVMLSTKDFELLDLMRRYDSPIRHKDLEWASNYYEFETLQYLAEKAHRSEIQNSGRYFRTFFFYEPEYRELAKKLIDKGANLNRARMISSRRLLLDFYVDEYVKGAPGYQKHGLSAIEFLVRNGADVHQYSRSIRPVFHHLIQKTDFESTQRLIDLFLEHGLNINQQNHYGEGRTALMELASMRPEKLDYSLQLAAFLVAKGANVNIQDNRGRTALHWAVRWANPAFVQQLNPFANKNLKDAKGRNAEEFALERFQSGPDYHKKNLAKILKILRQ